jgi:hypothetical protein
MRYGSLLLSYCSVGKRAAADTGRRHGEHQPTSSVSGATGTLFRQPRWGPSQHDFQASVANQATVLQQTGTVSPAITC